MKCPAQAKSEEMLVGTAAPLVVPTARLCPWAVLPKAATTLHRLAERAKGPAQTQLPSQICTARSQHTHRAPGPGVSVGHAHSGSVPSFPTTALPKHRKPNLYLQLQQKKCFMFFFPPLQAG